MTVSSEYPTDGGTGAVVVGAGPVGLTLAISFSVCAPVTFPADAPRRSTPAYLSTYHVQRTREVRR